MNYRTQDDMNRGKRLELASMLIGTVAFIVYAGINSQHWYASLGFLFEVAGILFGLLHQRARWNNYWLNRYGPEWRRRLS